MRKRLLAMLLATILVFMSIGVTAAEDGTVLTQETFKSHSLALSDCIGVIFYMDLSPLTEQEREASYMSFDISGAGTVEERAEYDPTLRNSTGEYYGFTCEVNAIQMADTLTATYHYGNEQTISETYSIRQYIQTFEAYQAYQDETTVALVHALADYGHHTQLFLSAVNNLPLGSDSDQYAPMDQYYTESYDFDFIRSEVEPFAISREKDDTALKSIPYTLILDSRLELCVYFQPTPEFDGTPVFKLDGKPVTAEEKNGRYTVSIPEILPHKIGDTYLITAEANGVNIATISISPLSYVYAILNSSAYANNLQALNAAASIYMYYKTAKAYSAVRNWNLPTYDWSEDNSTVTATRISLIDASVSETETVNTTSEITKPAACEETGEITYTATFENAAFETQTRTVEIPALGHAWGEVTYEWAADNSTVTATRVCANDANHVETETVNTTAVTNVATCETAGNTTYTATFENEAFETQTRTVEIPALGHAWGEWTVTTPATCTEAGVETRVCANDASHTETRAIEALGHAWGEVIYEWAADNSTVTATRVCANNANHIETETVNTTAVTTDATCEAAGSTTYTATFENEAFEAQTKTVEIPATGHAWGEWTVTTPATCTEAGVETRICANDASHTETRPIEALGHAWGEPTYEWAADNSTVTATRVCANNASHIETETVSATAVVNAATCEAAGSTTYTATFENAAFETQTRTVEIPALGHAWGEWTVTTPATCTEAGVETRICANDASHTETRPIEALGHAWGEPTYEWAADNSTVTATRVCANNASHIETETVSATAVVNAATCEAAGSTTYTATFENAAFETQTKTIEIEALGHAWGEVTYEWAADNSTVTATRVCANDANHIETETVSTTAVTNAATCEAAGRTTYTAMFENEAFETQTKTVEIATIGHDWEFVSFTWTGDDENGYTAAVANYVCKNDSTHTKTENATVTSETTAARCEAAGQTVYTATEGEHTETKTVAIPALGHAWGEWTVTTPATCTEAGVETRICANDASHTETRPIEALGHAWGEWTVTTPTTCTEAGVETRTCANDASHTETRPIEALGHAWGEWTVTTPATCTEAGVETRICANDASHTETRAIEALGHAWGEPTWSWTDGYTAASATFTCSHDGSHTHTVDATVAQNDCLGYTDYTATVSFNGQSYSDTKHVSFTAFYLIGPDWTAADINAANKFEVNPSNAAEYMLTVDLTAGDQIKVVKVEDGAITAWYPDGLNNEYTVDAAHAGDEKAIYFSETYRNDWSMFGGYIWIDASAQVQLNTFTHSDNLVNVDTYLYRVGNGNTVKLGSLFKVETEGDSAVVSDDVSVTIEKVETNSTAALGSYTKNSSDWMQSTLKFTGEGPVRVTVREGSGTPYTLNLEIVTAKNVTAYSELSNATCVLLNDITMTSNGQYSLANATLYGNGFVFDVKAGKYGNANGYESTNYVISLNNARLDNIQIVGKVYTDYGATRTDDYNFPCVLVNGGNCEIINSYISNCASPVRARGGASLYFENTTLKGGSFCNLDIRSGVNVTVNGLTTINQVNSNDAADNGTKILGLGIVFYYEGLNGDETLRITGNGLTQYNTVAKNQKNNAVSTANSAYNSMFTINSKFIYNDGTTQWVCTGILSLNSGIGSSNIDTPDGYDWQSVSMLGYSGYLCTKLAAAAQSAPDYVSTAQGPIAPGYSFEYPTAAGKKNYQAKTDGSSDYCYWDSTQKAILIGFAEGGSKNFDMDILTVTKNGCAITPTVSVDGGAYQDVSSSFAFTEEGEHILTYRYVDPYNYRYTDNQNTIGTYEASYTKTVKVTVTVAVASINPATFDFNGNGYRSVIANNTTYVMPNVSATATNSIGSKTIGGQTIYYPIVFTYYSTSENGSLTKTPTSQVSGSNMYTWCPIFDGVVTITDYDENSNQTTYGSSTTSMAEGKLICADSNALTTALTWMSASSPNLDPVTKNNKLYYRSTNASNNARSQKTYVIEYQYTDNAGNVYRYYIGYYFPDKQASCVAEGTQILMADGSQKAVEDVQMGDMVMTWSFENGCYEAAPVAIKWYHGTDDYRVLNLEFSDGTVVRVINTHGFFDRDLNTYAYIREGNADDYIGHTFVKRTPDGDNTEVVLVNSYITEEHVGNYSLQTAYNDNFIAENLLTITAEDHVGRFEYFPIGDNMMYDAEAKARDIETYGLYTYEEFADYLTEEQFIMFNGPYFKVLVGRGVLTYEDILEIIRVNLYANETAQ